MLFCVVKFTAGNNYRRVMGTNCKSCIYTEDEISNMYADGYQFLVNDKLVKISKSDKHPGKTVWAAINAVSDQLNTFSTSGSSNLVDKIHCITTDKYFNKQSEAAKFYGIDPAQVSDSIKTGRPRSGYVFEKVTANAK